MKDAKSGKGQGELPDVARPLLLLGVAVLAVLCYANTVSMEFVNWDDYKLIVDNPYIRGLNRENLGHVWSRPILETYLPLRVTSYGIDYHFWGLRPAGYHLTNVILHAVSSILVFAICARLTGSLAAGLFAGALFAAHPVHTEAVAWASGRKDVLSTVLFLLAYLLYVVSMDGGRRKWWLVLLSFSAFFLSGLAKAMVVTLPLLVILTDVIYGRALEEYRWLRLLPYWTVYFVAAVLLGGIALRFAASAGAIRPYHFGGAAKTALFMCWAALYYMKTMFFPNFLCARYPYGDTSEFGVDKTLVYASPFVLLGVIVAAVGLLAYASGNGKSQARPWVKSVAFGIAWFFVTLLPVMNFVSINVLVADRYLYLPSVGFIIAGAGVLWFLWGQAAGRGAVRRWAAGCLCFALVAAGAARTYARNEVWRDSYTLWSSVVSEFPKSVEARLQLASAYADTEPPDYTKALGELDTAGKLDSNAGSVRLARAKIFVKMGKGAQAASELEAARQLGLSGRSDVYDAFLAEAAALEAGGNVSGAAAAVEKAIAADPSRPEAHNNLGRLKGRLGDTNGAIESYKAAIRLDPKFAHAWYNLGVLASQAKDFSAATGYYKKALAADPMFAQAAVNLAVLYLDSGDAVSAVGLLENAVALKPQLVPAHVNLARAYVMLGDLEGAQKELETALRIDPLNKSVKELKDKFDAITKGVSNASQ